MKKALLIFTIFSLISLSIFSYSKNKTVSITGFIKCYGNEPFTYPGIETEDGKIYGIIAEPEIKNNLLNAQGNKIELTGQIINQNNQNMVPELQKDGFFEVESWEVIK